MKLMMILAASIGLASAAHANVGDIVVQGEPVARVVNFSDLDIGSASGRTKLSGRIRSAAEFVCEEANIDPLDVRLARQRCYRVAVANGEAKADVMAAGRASGR
jgi:UrcA family protein